MRVFTAIPLPKDAKDKFTELSRGRLPVPYINTTNLHITLNFLGELDTDQFMKVMELWTKDLPELKKLSINFDKLTRFRQQIHMTLKDNPGLMAMQELLKNHFERLGFKSSYPKYYPHVTITNLHMDKVMHRERKIENFPNNELEQLSFVAERIVLYESRLLLHHAKHIELAEYKLV